MFNTFFFLFLFCQLNFYRFSISWSRILPRGDISIINEAGVAYYNQLIDELILNGIEPVVTMFHWDMPLPLHHLGGFTNPIISEYFNEYANLLFQRYGDRVKRWITFNEPFNSCLYGYGNGLLAPFIKASNIGAEYYCSHNLLIAHAKAYRLYKSVYSVVQNGKVGISLSSQFYYIKPTSESNSVDNNKAIVDRALQFHVRETMFALLFYFLMISFYLPSYILYKCDRSLDGSLILSLVK